jgi:5-methylcytosine-specific restriction endonuclease McrA
VNRPAGGNASGFCFSGMGDRHVTGFSRTTPRIKCLPLSPLRPLDTRTVRTPSAVKLTAGFYKSPEWKALMRALIAERGRVCESCGARGVRIYGDHIEELADGGAALDTSNIELLCGSCHNKKTAMARESRGDIRHLLHPEGLARSLVPLTIVCGPPASGKTTWVRTRAAPGDLVIDLDEIKAKLFGVGLHSFWSAGLMKALEERNRLLAALGQCDAPWPAAWFIVGEPTAIRRAWWQRMLQPSRIVVMETPEDVCLARIDASADRAKTRGEQSVVVAKWWSAYTRRAGEERVGYGQLSTGAQDGQNPS